MESIFVLTHTDESGNALTRGSLEAVATAKELADILSAPLAIGILGADNAAVAASVAGASARIFAVSGEAFAQARYATDAAACEALCRAAQPTIVLAPGSSRFARVAAGVAHRMVAASIPTSLPWPLPMASRLHAGSTDNASKQCSRVKNAHGSCCSIQVSALRSQEGTTRLNRRDKCRIAGDAHRGERLSRPGAGCANHKA